MVMDARDIVDAFSLRNATLVRDELIASCPFTENHRRGDARPSFSVNVEKGLYHCLGCGESGNVVQLAQRLLGMTYVEAQRRFYGDLTDDEVARAFHGQDQEGRKPMTAMDMEVSRWCPRQHPYWESRGFTAETVGMWNLGYDESCNRAVVPVVFNGETVGWSKRAVGDFQPKWVHSPGMQKSRMLFGLDALEGDSAILVEAPLSAIMLWQHGIKNAVASFGANLSDEQAVLLRRNCNNLLVFYDPDDAGRKGTELAIAKLEPFLNVYVVQPTRDDPAAMSREENFEAIHGKPVVPSWAWVY